jgi:hypothetical protein
MVADAPSGDGTHAERSELDALRRRAYGPDADILDDAIALARLRELEDGIRGRRLDIEPAVLNAPAVQSMGAPARTSRWNLKVVGGTMVTAVLLGAIAWGTQEEPTGEAPEGRTDTAAGADTRREVDGQRYVDDLRAEVAALPGTEAIANRMIRSQLRPYGILFGRIVAAGRTVDDEFCMIIADLPASSITCIPVEKEKADPVSVTLPAWLSDSESDLFTGLGPLVSYTLMPGGEIVAAPAE